MVPLLSALIGLLIAVRMVDAVVLWNSNGFSSSARLLHAPPLSTNMSSTVMLDAWPVGVTFGTYGFETAVFDGTLIWLIPRMASHLVYIDPSNGDTMTAVTLPGQSGSTSAPQDKFVGGAYDGEGGIWLPPYAAGYFMHINVTSRTATKLTDGSLNATERYAGAAYDGVSVWCAPIEAQKLLRIDRRPLRGHPMMSAPFMGQIAPSYFTGVIFDGTRVWFVPGYATNILAIDTTTYNARSLDTWPAGVGPRGDWQTQRFLFVGGCFDGARVWLAPGAASAVAYVNVNTMTIGTVALSFEPVVGTLSFRTAFFDGLRVWLVPYTVNFFLSIESMSEGGSQPTWHQYRSAVNGLGGAVSDGRHLYFAPMLRPHRVMKLPHTSWTDSLTPTAPSRNSASSTRSIATPGTRVGTPPALRTVTRAESHSALTSSSKTDSCTMSASAMTAETHTTAATRSLSKTKTAETATVTASRSHVRSTTAALSSTLTQTQSHTKVPPGGPADITGISILSTTAFKTSSGSVAGGATSVAAAVAGNPGAAMQAARAMSILALSACHFRHDVAVSFPLSMWPGFEVGPGRQGSYYRGAVAANVATLVGVCAAGMVVCMIRTCVTKKDDDGHHSATRRCTALTAAMGWAKFPGFAVGPFGMLLTGTVASSVAAAAHGSAETAVDASLAGCGLVVCALGIGLCVYNSVTVTTRYCRVVPVMRDSNPSARCPSAMAWFEPRESEWGPRRDDDARDRAMARMFRPLYQRYRVECPWYYGFDATLTYLVAVAQGSMPEGRTKCLAAMGVVLVPCVAALAGVVILRPDNSDGKLWLHGAATSVTLMSAVLAVMGIATEVDWLVAASQVSAVVATAIGVSSALVSLSLLLYRHGTRKARRANGVAFGLADEELLTAEPRLLPASTGAVGHNSSQSPELRLFAAADVAEVIGHSDSALTSYRAPDDAHLREAIHNCDAVDAHRRPSGCHRNAENQRLHDELTALLYGGRVTHPLDPSTLGGDSEVLL